MLLKKLYDFAHSRKLLDDLAFATKAIRWVIPLDSEGYLIGGGPIETVEDKRGKKYLAPQTSRNKNGAGVAEFLADGVAALFSLDTEPEKYKDDPKARNKRDSNNKAKQDDFWRQIQEAHTATGHEGLQALLKFRERISSLPSFLRWGVSQEKPDEKSAWWLKTAKDEEVKFKADNLTFQVDGEILLNNEDLRDWWRKAFTEEREETEKEADDTKGICLISGLSDVPIARIHSPKIKIGFKDTPPGGAAIVSFEKSSPSFSSFGLSQSHNAPASLGAVSAYCNALNYLLGNKQHHLSIGQIKVCYWARDGKSATDFFADLLNQADEKSVREFLVAPFAGIEKSLADKDEFYSVTLSGNAGRIVVRHWMQMTLTQAVTNFRQWFADLEIAPYGARIADAGKRRAKKEADDLCSDDNADKSSSPLSLFRLALTTVREPKDLLPDIPAGLYRASIEGIAPPLQLLKPILNRLEISLIKDGANTALRNLSRFALLRLLVNRHRKEGDPMIEPQVFETNDAAYNCGRLLALFDDLQREALSTEGNRFDGAGVVEKYYGSASSAPNSAFGILWRLHQHHLKKVSQKGDRGKAAAFAIKRKIAEIAALFPQPAPNQPPQFPRTFSLQQQGRFALGFYQQKAVDDAARREHKAKNQSDVVQPHSGG